MRTTERRFITHSPAPQKPARSKSGRTTSWNSCCGVFFGALAISPSSMRTVRSAKSSTRESWVTMTTARSCWCARSRIISITLRPVCESSAAVGSSARTISGSPARARAMATRCFCPPLRVVGKAVVLVREPHLVEQGSRPFLGGRLVYAFQIEHQLNVLCGRQGREEVESLEYKADFLQPHVGHLPRLQAVTSCPEMRTLPDVARQNAAHDGEQRGLAAARGADQHDQFSAADVQINAAQRGHHIAALGIALRKLADFNCRLHTFPFFVFSP